MAQHKAPTSVTIAPISEKAGLAEFVDRYWKIGVALALAVTAVLLYRVYSRSEEAKADSQSWEKLSAATSRDMFGNLTGEPEKLAEVANEVKGRQAGPWALYLAATSAAAENKYDAAKQYVARLRQEFPTHALVTDQHADGADGAKRSIVEDLEARISAQIAWRAQYPGLFGNPELPPNAPRVRVNTNEGSFTLGLYVDQAPKHCENLLRLAREGTYNGIKFHRVKADNLLQGGDPNTLKDDVSQWGAGGAGPDLDEEVNTLKHFAGALGAARMPGSKKSNGSQFYISVGDNHPFDGNYVVYGKVVEGMDVVKRLSELKVVPGTERPEMPPQIQSMEVL